MIGKGITISEYITWTQTSAVYPEKHSADYLAFGFLDELGELCGLLKREIREDKPRDNAAVLLEASDIGWYLARLWNAEQWEDNRIVWLEGLEPEWTVRDLVVCMATHMHQPVCMLYFFELIKKLGFTLDQVLDANVAKIEGRKVRGTVMGKGDYR
jgi:hypothetical protein